MNLSKESIDKLKSQLSADILFHETELKRLKADISSLDEASEVPSINVISRAFDKPVDSNKTFSDTVKDILLLNNRPMTSRDLLVEFNKIKNVKFSMLDFSPRLSPLAKSEKVIKSYKVEGAKIELKNWYGLSGWFNGDSLKEPYLSKIKKENE